MTQITVGVQFKFVNCGMGAFFGKNRLILGSQQMHFSDFADPEVCVVGGPGELLSTTSNFNLGGERTGLKTDH